MRVRKIENRGFKIQDLTLGPAMAEFTAPK